MVTVEPVKLTQLVQLTLVAGLGKISKVAPPENFRLGNQNRISSFASAVRRSGLFEGRRDARWWLCPSVYCAHAGAV